MRVASQKTCSKIPPRRATMYWTATALTTAAATLYLLFPSSSYNGDGLGYAILVEQASPDRLWSVSGRLLFCPTGRFIQQSLADIGWYVRSVYVLQWFNSLMGALGVGVFFLAAFRVSRRLSSAIAVALGLAFSCAFWVWNVDCTSYPGYLFFLICALYVLTLFRDATGMRQTWLYLVLLGFLHALAGFYWLTAVLLGPSIAVSLLFLNPRITIGNRIGAILLYSLSFAVFLFVPLFIAAVETKGVSSPGEFYRWLSSAQQGVPPELSVGSVFRGIFGFSSSIFHMVELGPFVKARLWGIPFAVSSRLQLCLEVATFLILWLMLPSALGYLLRYRRSVSQSWRRLVLALLLWAAPVTLFGLVWLGSDTERWLATMPIFWMIVLAVVSDAQTRFPGCGRLIGTFLWVLAGLAFGYNLSVATLPRHNPENNYYLQTAKFLTSKMSDRDRVFLWGHDHVFSQGHLEYFFAKKCTPLMQDLNKQPDRIDSVLTVKVLSTFNDGGRVFVIGRVFLDTDLPESRYSESELGFDRREVGKTLSRWKRRPAFTFGKDTYWELLEN